MTEKIRKNIALKPGERIDELERNGYGIIQNPEYFCFGMDAVLLSGFAKVKKGEIVVDLCTGTGIIPILLEAKTEGGRFYGVEIQEEVAEMASRSVALNGLEEKVTILQGDLREPIVGIEGKVSVVTVNPPYMKTSHGLKNPDASKAIARHEVMCTLKDVCEAAGRLLQQGGRLYMVHRPLRLPEIFAALSEAGFEPKRLKPVYPYADREATMVLIEAVKGAGKEMRFEKPVTVYKEDGTYTDEIYDIYGY